MALKQPDKIKSNNPAEYGIVDATEVAGHKSVQTLSELYALSDAILSPSKTNANNDAIGQEWYVIGENCGYKLVEWDNRRNENGWNRKGQEIKNDDNTVIPAVFKKYGHTVKGEVFNHTFDILAENGDGASFFYPANKATGVFSHAEGLSNTSDGFMSHSEGLLNLSDGYASHSEGRENKATGSAAHAEGYITEASGNTSHAEGAGCMAIGLTSHAEGNSNIAYGNSSHAEGVAIQNIYLKGDAGATEYEICAGRLYSERDELLVHKFQPPTFIRYFDRHLKASVLSSKFVDGRFFITLDQTLDNNSPIDDTNKEADKSFFAGAIGKTAHSEGTATFAKGLGTHAEGTGSVAEGQGSHAEGDFTYALGVNSHTEGESTVTRNRAEHAQGFFNKSNSKTLDSVGIGERLNRKNATETMTNGDHYIVGIGGYDGTNPDTSQSVQQVITSLSNRIEELERKLNQQVK